jgi:hypothetical protein
MSSTPDVDSDGDQPWDDAEQWTSLSRDEQSAALDAGLADLRGDQGDGAWRHRSEQEQRATIAAIERDADAGSQATPVSDAERAMQAALEQPWTAEIFRHDDAIPTVPFECRELTGAEQAKLQEAGRIMMSLEERVEAAAGDADLDDLEAVDIDSEHFDEVSDLDDWIPELLGDVVVADEFDAERFRTGERLRSNTRRELFMELFARYEEEIQRAQEFRQESSRP